jgi:hypothetical protein
MSLEADHEAVKRRLDEWNNQLEEVCCFEIDEVEIQHFLQFEVDVM